MNLNKKLIFYKRLNRQIKLKIKVLISEQKRLERIIKKLVKK